MACLRRYTLAFLAHQSGLAPCRPMYYEYPWQENAYARTTTSAQYMVGPDLIVAPVVTPLVRAPPSSLEYT